MTETTPDEKYVTLQVTNEHETATAMMAAKAEAEAKSRYAIAKVRPRDEDAARQRILHACKRPRFAGAAVYAKPVGNNKKVMGLSVRFAEECLRMWGNLVQETVVILDNDNERILNCVVTDLETNATVGAPIVIEKTVERQQPRKGDEVLSVRENSYGKKVYRIRANDDALMMKTQNLAAKLRRGLILQLIPGDVKEEALELCMRVAADAEAHDPDSAMRRVLDAFYQLGVDATALKGYVGKPLAQLTGDDIVELRAIHQSIVTGESTWAEFASAATAGGDPDAVPAGLTERLKAKAATATAAAD